ncbi:uncharacterized protein PG998_005172 [Apiospora kogelbergensis]|uniref:uncharacterized protein n=1 Tax=Apiospora kogelbergensis TaxID=1337665 RepID=UPI00312CE9DE
MSRLIAPLVAAKLTMAQKIVGHVFRDAQLGVEALTAPGAVRTLENGALSYDGNASLALLGDGILRVGVGLQSRRLCETKGLSSLRISRAANNGNLARVCDTSCLTDCIVLHESTQGFASDKMKGTTVEAVLGAVFLDADLEAALAVMRQLKIE